MDHYFRQDIIRFFSVYKNNTSDLIAPLHPVAKKEMEEELDALKASVLRRISREMDE